MSSGAALPAEKAQERQARIREIEVKGYTVLENAIEPELVDALLADLDRITAECGTVPAENFFEGEKTLRVYNLLALGRIWQRAVSG